MPTHSITATAGRVKALVSDHPDVENVELVFADLTRTVRISFRHVSALTSDSTMSISFGYSLLTLKAWKDIEALAIQDLNLVLTQWDEENKKPVSSSYESDDVEKGLRDPEGAVYPSKLPHEMQVQSPGEPEPRFGPFTPAAIEAANKEAKDRLWGAPTDHPVVLALRHQAKDLMVNMLLNIEPSRRRSLALSDLEQSLMWAIKGVFEKKEN